MSATGWLLPMRGKMHFAVGARELVYVLPEEPQIHQVPLAPAAAPGVIVWENRVVPIIDVGLLLGGTHEAADDRTMSLAAMRYVAGIVAYAGDAAADGGVELGALIFRKVPEQVEVSDDQARELPDELVAHAALFTSCFEHVDLGPIPVLNLAALFSRAHAALVRAA
ncbi:MAG: chemotaxis protein CheW [Steroidobacteraceae bacterium]|jgi:chemotaxis signal transduction protein